MADQSCENCSFRSKYDNNPKSFLGRLWRWHAGWCPGWKSFMKSLPEENRKELAERFHYAQKFVQDDPWKARAEGVDKHEFTPLKQVG